MTADGPATGSRGQHLRNRPTAISMQPAPAVSAILKRYRIPHVTGPVDVEILTPTGAAILAALQPRWRCREIVDVGRLERVGLGLGTKELTLLNGLWLYLTTGTD